MSQLFALEWDPREIRLMVASGRGRQVVIEQAFSIPCETDSSAADTAEQIGRRIAAELDARGLGPRGSRGGGRPQQHRTAATAIAAGPG